MDTGADIRNGSVWLRRSSAISRIDSNGTTISSTIEAVPKTGAATISVSPGRVGIMAICGCTSRNICSRIRKIQARMSCRNASITHASGEANSSRSSFMAMTRIMPPPRPPGAGPAASCWVSCTNTSSRVARSGAR